MISRPLAAALALALAASPALAQSAQTAPRDPVAELLSSSAVQDPYDQPALPAPPGEIYRRAPDSAQNPAEVAETERLNAQIAAGNDAADRIDADNAYAAAQAQADYEARMAQFDADNQRIAAETQSNADAYAEAQARYEQAMADWRATQEACRRGDSARCRAGQTVARPAY